MLALEKIKPFAQKVSMNRLLKLTALLLLSYYSPNLYASDQEPKFESSFIEDADGNIIDPNDTLKLGDEVTLVITANKASNGLVAAIDLEEMACSHQLLTQPYKIIDGIIDDIIINGDSPDPEAPERVLNNQTRLRFIAINETRACLTLLEKAKKKRYKSTLCKKRSWPFRSSNTPRYQTCRKK